MARQLRCSDAGQQSSWHRRLPHRGDAARSRHGVCSGMSDGGADVAPTLPRFQPTSRWCNGAYGGEDARGRKAPPPSLPSRHRFQMLLRQIGPNLCLISLATPTYAVAWRPRTRNHIPDVTLGSYSSSLKPNVPHDAAEFDGVHAALYSAGARPKRRPRG